ncbi:single stranded DNA-binding domain-containing protein [Isobaculum melis]|uniref:Single-strand binding protein family protein n=1 Tax=Isobaculum melis TaxID=142588 RepID=A0A1H9QJU1_9LACT|nr:hypothetical protein [Isobaculum melis]SER60465.1 hypothetical protein SAMN04488559_102110 [Isobaculum melis]
MNYASITGTITSDIKIIHTKNNRPFARFTLENEHQTFNCLIANQKAYPFTFYVIKGAVITIDASINERMQLVVMDYFVHQQPNTIILGRVFNYQKKIYAKLPTF